jgi:hypothetical protein
MLPIDIDQSAEGKRHAIRGKQSVNALRGTFHSSIATSKQEGSAENTDSRKSGASHGGGPGTGTLTARAASRRSRRSVHGSGGDADAVACAGLDACGRAGGDSCSDDRRSGGASCASAPCSPRRLSALTGPARPGAAWTIAASPPASPGACSPVA